MQDACTMLEKGICSGSACPAGSDLDDIIELHIGKAAAKTFSKAKAVCVEAFRHTIVKGNGVHRADASCLVAQLVEQRNDLLLERMRDVDTGEAPALRRVECRLQAGDTFTGDGKVKQRICEANALSVSFTLVKPRRAGCLNILADQPAKNAGRRSRPIRLSVPRRMVHAHCLKACGPRRGPGPAISLDLHACADADD